MHFQLKKTIVHAGVLTALLPALSALAAEAGAKIDPSTAPKRGAYVYDSFNRNTRAGATGNCVYDGFWNPQTATPECDPNLFASPSTPAVAPRAAAQAQPQAQAQAAPAEEPKPAAESVPEFVSEPEPAGMVPVPAPESFAPEAAAATLSAPVMFYDSDAEEAKDDGIIAQSVYGDDDSGVAQDDGIISQYVYGDDDSGLAADDGILSQNVYGDDDSGLVKDDGIIAQSMYYDEEEGAAKDDGIIAENRYYDEEEGAKKDEGIIAQSEYYDEDEGALKEEDILAQNVYGSDDSGRAPEEVVSEPKTFPEEKIAQAEPSKPVTVLPVTVTVEADPLFDFDKSAVRADSRRKLDDLLQQLKGVTFGDVIAVGFADPIGSAMYNQKLSERRASSVKAYLTGHGIPADKIRVEGRGETEEYASYESCGGLRKNKLISCLQPDRRVEVTVTAQKQP